MPTGSYQISYPPDELHIRGLGSCIAVAIFSRFNSIGGLTHAMLPEYRFGIDKSNLNKYVDTCIVNMIDDIISRGVLRYTLKAKIVGGAQMFSYLPRETFDIGKRNTEIARKVLQQEGIPVVSEDTGGNQGRNVVFDLETFDITIKTTYRTLKI